MKDQYLSHHGILGQKWGIRRYQNEDGTLTQKGLVREQRIAAKKQKDVEKGYAIARDKQEGKPMASAARKKYVGYTIAALGGITMAKAGARMATKKGNSFCNKALMQIGAGVTLSGLSLGYKYGSDEKKLREYYNAT